MGNIYLQSDFDVLALKSDKEIFVLPLGRKIGYLKVLGTISDDVSVIFAPIHHEKVWTFVLEVHMFETNLIAFDNQLSKFRMHGSTKIG